MKKYSVSKEPYTCCKVHSEIKEPKIFDKAPNDEEATNDPLCEQKADYHLEMENAIERELRLKGNKITVESLIDNDYLNGEILKCLKQFPLLMLE